MVGKKFKCEVDFQMRFYRLHFQGDSRLCATAMSWLSHLKYCHHHIGPQPTCHHVLCRFPSLLCYAAHIRTKGCHQHPLQANQTSQSAKWLLDKSKQLEWDRNSTVSGWEPQWMADCMALLGEAGQLSMVLLRNDNGTSRRCTILIC